MPGHNRTPAGPIEAQVPPIHQTAERVSRPPQVQLRGAGYEAGRQMLNPDPAAAAKAKARAEGKLEGLDFQEMWEAHPHNYQDDPTQDTSSSEVQEELGWDPNQYGNTCAIRLSVMLNELGGAYKITREKAAAAGIPRGRLAWSRTKKSYYILSAREIWTYAMQHFGAPDKTWPARGRFKDNAEFEAAFDKEVKPAIQGKKGFVAFDKIFGYSGSGHVDLFDGEKMSDSGSWYGSRRLMIWYV